MVMGKETPRAEQRALKTKRRVRLGTANGSNKNGMNKSREGEGRNGLGYCRKGKGNKSLTRPKAIICGLAAACRMGLPALPDDCGSIDGRQLGEGASVEKERRKEKGRAAFEQWPEGAVAVVCAS